MAFATYSAVGSLTGTTAVTVVAAPAADTDRLIKTLAILNRDTVSHEITGTKVVGGAGTVVFEVTLGAGEQLIWDHVVALSETNESFTIVSDALATTTEPTYMATYGDAT